MSTMIREFYYSQLKQCFLAFQLTSQICPILLSFLLQGRRYCFVTSTEKKHGLSGPLKVTMVWLQLKKPSLTSSGKLLMLLPPLTLLLLLRIFRTANSGMIMKIKLRKWFGKKWLPNIEVNLLDLISPSTCRLNLLM